MPEYVVLFKKPGGLFMKINTFDKGFDLDYEQFIDIFGEEIFYSKIANSKEKIIMCVSDTFEFTKCISNYYGYVKEGRGYLIS